MKKGIDISHFQGNPDFAKVKTAVDFVIMQAGYGKYSSQKDKCFESNYAGCKKHGIPCGVYWFSYATTVADAKLEAKACLEAIKGKIFEYPIYFDVEGKSLVGRTGVTAMCDAFCSEIEKAGYFAGIYISRSPAQTMLDTAVAKKYALWLAEYGSKCNYAGSYGMWQYSSSGRVPGITDNVDMDYSYVDYPAKIIAQGLNGFPKPVKVLDKSGFKKGNKTLGVLALKQMLMKLGYKLDNNNGFGSGTEKAVNDLLKKWGYKQTGIAGTNFIKKLGGKL